MNREQKRLLQRQGQIGADGEPAPKQRERQPRPSVATQAAARSRTKPREFLHEVNIELRKVAWPTRAETINYSTVVLITLIIVIIMIFFLDYGFSAAARFLFK